MTLPVLTCTLPAHTLPTLCPALPMPVHNRTAPDSTHTLPDPAKLHLDIAVLRHALTLLNCATPSHHQTQRHLDSAQLRCTMPEHCLTTRGLAPTPPRPCPTRLNHHQTVYESLMLCFDSHYRGTTPLNRCETRLSGTMPIPNQPSGTLPGRDTTPLNLACAPPHRASQRGTKTKPC